MQQLEKETPLLDVERQIARLELDEQRLVEEAQNLPNAEIEAQRTGDPMAVREVHARGEELPELIAHAKAERLEAQATLEEMRAARHGTEDPETKKAIAKIDAEIAELIEQRQVLQGLLDRAQARQKEHKLMATEHRSEAYRLRRVHGS